MSQPKSKQQHRLPGLFLLVVAVLGLLVASATGQSNLGAGPSELRNLVADLQHRVSSETWSRLTEDPTTKPFMDALCGDQSWLEDLLDSGPLVEAGPSLEFLSTVWNDAPGLSQNLVNRSMATACALELGGGRSRLDQQRMLARYHYFRDSYSRGLLNVCYGALKTWERRFLAHGAQWAMTGEQAAWVYLRDAVSIPRAKYVKACWRAPYRSFNALGDSVQRPTYYAPFHESYNSPVEMVIDVGGVCGALSNTGASAAIANGIPAATMGEPGHCAYVVKTDDHTWSPAYSLSWKRSLHTSFYSRSWSALLLTEACFSDAARMKESSALARRARSSWRSRNTKAADQLFSRALDAHPLHYELWLEWASLGAELKRPAGWWRVFSRRLKEGLADYPDLRWSILKTRVYPSLLTGLAAEKKMAVFSEFNDSLRGWGKARWSIESAWKWMVKKLPKAARQSFVRRLSRKMSAEKDLGAPLVAFVLGRHKNQGPSKEKAIADLLKDIDTAGDGGKPTLKHLAAKLLPASALAGDVALFQTIGEAVSSLTPPVSMKGIKPFPGNLLSDGGLLLVAGAGGRYDTPQSHWGVLGARGGRCHTKRGPASIAVRLESRARVTGIILQNSIPTFNYRANGARVEISDDGKEWRQVGTLEGSKEIHHIDLSGEPHECSWVRIAKGSDFLHLKRFLVYGYRRS